MRLDISEVLREVGKVLPYDVEEPPLVDEDVECMQPITGRITFNNTGGLLLISGRAKTTVALACSRCAQYFESPVTLNVNEQFELNRTSTSSRSLQTVTVIEEDENPIAGKLFDGQVFDLTEMLRQGILLDEPTRPLPPTLPDGRCAHCKRTPEEVLKIAESMPDAEAEGTPINPAFAELGKLLKEKE